MENKIKACWFCKYFRYVNSNPDYSEWTGGNDFGIVCLKRHWEFDSGNTPQEKFGEILQTANKCKDYIEELVHD